MLDRATLSLVPLLVASPALAQAPVTVASDDPCVTSELVAEHLASWLDAPLDPGVEVVLEVGGGRASFQILVRGARAGARSFDRLPADCADRRAVITLAIAMTLDETVMEAFAEQAPDEVAEPPPVAPPLPAPPAPSATVGVGFRLEASALVGLLPEVAFAGAVDVAVLLPEGWSLHAAAAGTAPTFGALGSGAVEITLIAGRAALCLGRAVAPPLSLEGCVGVWSGVGRGRGQGFADERTAELPVVLPSARLEARVTLVPWLEAFLFIDGLIAAVRPRFVVEGALHERALGELALSAGGGLALVLR